MGENSHRNKIQKGYKRPSGRLQRLWDNPPPYGTRRALSNDTLTFEVKVTVRGQVHFKGKTSREF